MSGWRCAPPPSWLHVLLSQRVATMVLELVVEAWRDIMMSTATAMTTISRLLLITTSDCVNESAALVFGGEMRKRRWE